VVHWVQEVKDLFQCLVHAENKSLVI